MRVALAGLQPVARDVPIIAFVGNAVCFPSTLLRLASSDLPDLRVRRYASLDELRSAEPGTIVVAVLEEGYADRLAEDRERVQAVAPGAHLALAYRDQGVAVGLLRTLSRRRRLGELCLLPMRVPYDAWRSILSLVVGGEGYLPRDVVAAALMPGPGAEPDQAPPRAAAPERPATNPAGPPMGNLTGREVEVLGLVSRGKQNKSVAAELGLSEHTVKLHMHHVITKLGARNRTEATIWYLSRFGAAGGPPGVERLSAADHGRPLRPN